MMKAILDWHYSACQPYFIHEQKMIKICCTIPGKRIHFAVVVDEFGGPAALLRLKI
jgi:Mg2+/Co2+ transporter CorB